MAAKQQAPAGATWKPAEWDPADASAIQALAAGIATPEMQKRALDWIITRAAATYELSFVPGMDSGTAFGEGRRFVGMQIVKLLKINLGRLRSAHERSPNEQQ